MRTSVRWLFATAVAVGVFSAAALAAVSDSRSDNGAEASPTWDVLWISDSSGAGAAPLYAQALRRSRGVSVRRHDVGGLDVTTLLQRLRQPDGGLVRLVRDAEVIVVEAAPLGLGIDVVERLDCVKAGCQKPLPCTAATWQPYASALKAVYRRIFAIREGRPVVLRTYNLYVPILTTAPPDAPGTSWTECGIVAPCMNQWRLYNGAIARSASAYRMPVADVWTAFNGPTHSEDPVKKGLIGRDGVHPSTKGSTVMAALLARLGYSVVKPIPGAS